MWYWYVIGSISYLLASSIAARIVYWTSEPYNREEDAILAFFFWPLILGLVGPMALVFLFARTIVLSKPPKHERRKDLQKRIKQLEKEVNNM